MDPEQVKLLKDTADIGLGYACQLIEWFGTAERAIDYLTADYHKQHDMLALAHRGAYTE